MFASKEKWKTWWWYHRIHVLIAAAALGVILYSVLPNLLAPEPDYTIAVVGKVPLREETLAAVKAVFESAAQDRNGDGRILIELNPYTLDLSGETAGTLNYQGAAAFDADLVGKKSSIFLLDDAAGFRANVVTPVEEMLPCAGIEAFARLLPEGYCLTARSDGDGIALCQKLRG